MIVYALILPYGSVFAKLNQEGRQKEIHELKGTVVSYKWI
jgi:hypothetical protein